jgi:hypothetical protein
LNAGDSFLIRQDGASYDSHLWFIISDPGCDHFILIANFTSWREDKDLSCVVEPHEHPYLSKTSCVNYAKSKIVPTIKIEQLIESSHIIPNAPLSPELLKRIREGAGNSPEMHLGNWQYLVDQGVVED